METVQPVPRDPLELQAELLRYRACLVDPVTGLPTLPLVLEEVRKLLERYGTLRVFAIELEHEEDLEVMVGWEEYDRLIGLVASHIKSTLSAYLPHGALVAVDKVHGERFFVFLSPQLATPELARRLARPAAEIRQPSGGGSYLLRVGRGLIRRSPAQRVERCIYSGIAQAERDLKRKTEELDARKRQELVSILRRRAVRTLFQPIVRLPERSILGFESLSRGPEGGHLEAADALFAFAEKEGLRGELERLCIEKALARAHVLPMGTTLFFNLSLEGLEFVEQEEGGLATLVRTAGWSPRECVLEITEHTYAKNPEVVRQKVLGLRRSGFRVAIDDMGAGYSSLNLLAELQPDFIKLDYMLVHDLHHWPIKRNLISALINFAKNSRCLVIAEGVEKAEEVAALQKLGVSLLQGFYFGRPRSYD